MTPQLTIPLGNPIELQNGWPSGIGIRPLPLAHTLWSSQDFGTILFHEIQTSKYLFRYFIFSFYKEMTLLFKEQGEGLQSLISYKGDFNYSYTKKQHHKFLEGQFLLFNAGENHTEATFKGGKECHIFNTYYTPGALPDFLALFPKLKMDIDAAFIQSKPLPSQPLHRQIVNNAIWEILTEEFNPALQQFFWEQKLREKLFRQLAEVYNGEHDYIINPNDKRIAETARSILVSDLRENYTYAEIAAQINTSESSLRRAFRRVFGITMIEFMKRLKMHTARERLAKGEMSKNIAVDLGMRPTNFAQEFRKYFGHPPSAVRNKD